ncbi:MAG: hypothetical protein F8N37_05645 [Telmatospirillum sp.]|nr:hypothetical protein [Telmatospirillum sp.]
MRLLALERQALFVENSLPFGNCHASTLAELPDGGLIAAFFAGEREGTGDTAIWTARYAAGRWSPPRRQFARDGHAHWNPVLHAEGKDLWLFYKVGATVHDWITWTARSGDAGEHWTAPVPLVPGDRAPRGPVKNKLIVTSDGSWVAPGSVETERFWDAFADLSGDKGATWTRRDVPIVHQDPGSRPSGGETWQGLSANALWESDPAKVFAWDGVIQPTLWESVPGRLHMLLRSTRGRIFRSESGDGGQSWSPARATDLPNNNSGIDLVRLDDGTLVLAYNPIEGNWGCRSPLSLSLTADNGTTWTQPWHLETGEGEFSYPAIIARGRDIHVTYTANRKTIVHRRIRVE